MPFDDQFKLVNVIAVKRVQSNGFSEVCNSRVGENNALICSNNWNFCSNLVVNTYNLKTKPKGTGFKRLMW